jgi:protein-disulfide isomerase
VSTGTASAGRMRIPPAFALALLAVALMIGLLVAAQRHGPIVESPAEAQDRAQIEEVVRQYILDHPEIIPQAIGLLQEREVSSLLDSNREQIETPFEGAFAGNPDGDVVLVELFDYACPYCRTAHEDLQRLIRDDPGLKVVYRDFPVLSAESEEAALASLAAARQGRYAAFHDALFESSGRLTRQRIIAAVRAAGMDEHQASRDMKSAELAAEIRKNQELARALGVTGTPTYLVGSRILAGAVGYDALKEAVAQARRRRAD